MSGNKQNSIVKILVRKNIRKFNSKISSETKNLLILEYYLLSV